MVARLVLYGSLKTCSMTFPVKGNREELIVLWLWFVSQQWQYNVRGLTALSSSVARKEAWEKEKSPWGRSLAAMVMVASCLSGLIAEPGVRELSLSWYTRLSSGISSSSAYRNRKWESILLWVSRWFTFLQFTGEMLSWLKTGIQGMCCA